MVRGDAEGEAVARAARLEEVAAALSAVNTLEGAAQVAVEAIAAALQARGGALTVTRPEGDALELCAFWGAQAEGFEAFRLIPLEASLPVTDAVRTKRPVLIGTRDEMLARYPHLEGAPHSVYRAWAAIPLLVEDGAVGGAWFLFDAPRTFTQADETMMMTIGGKAAQAITRAKLFAAEREARARAERLLEQTRRLGIVTGRVSQAMSAEELARAGIDDVRKAIGADSGMLYLMNEEGDCLTRFRSVGWFPAGEDVDARVPLGVSAAMTDAARRRSPVWLEGRADYVARYPASATRFRDLIPSEGLSMAHLPLTVEDRVLGVLVFAYYSDRKFDEPDRRFMSLLADHCALSLSRVRLFQQREESARRAEAAYQAAKEAERRKDEFLAMLGHELRNPLAPILTALQLMRLKRVQGADRELVVIERQVRHLERLVEDLLDVSRITQGKVALKREIVEMGHVVAKAVELSSPLLEQKRHRLSVLVPRESLSVDGDPVRLTQVLTNLLNNAAKYTEPGGEVTIAASREAQEIVIAVRDSGMGIPAELLPHVFDMFTQAPQTLARAHGGLGLGLSIVKSLVEMHGGVVAAHSDGVGKGSAFIVRLPAAAPMVRDPATPPAASMPSSVEGGAAPRVLVVDDNRDAANLLAEALSMLGYVVETAFDGPSALRMARRFRPEIGLIDIGLPVLDGYEVARRLRRDVLPEAKLKLLAVTGYGQDHDWARALSAGFDGHLVKPVDINALVQAVRAPRHARR